MEMAGICNCQDSGVGNGTFKLFYILNFNGKWLPVNSV